jgi:beta-lactamase regulating signal transducer with metallopeptidase domain
MDTLVHFGLTNALLATGLALIVAGVAFLFRRRPAVVHGLWLLVLLRFLIPSFYPIEIPGCNNLNRIMNWKSKNAGAEIKPTSMPETILTTPNSAALDEETASRLLVRTDSLKSKQIPSQTPANTASPVQPLESVAVVPVDLPETATSFTPSKLPESHAWEFSWEQTIGSVWLAGTFIWTIVAGIRIARFRRILKLAQPADRQFHNRIRKLAQSLGLSNSPKGIFVTTPIPPMLWALGTSSRLLIPRILWDRLTDEQRDTLLIHELAHLRRGDHWVRRLEMVVLALYWWHPVLWWARRQLREAEEQCCDAWVVWALPQSGHGYAVALVETMSFLSQSGTVLPLGASGIVPMRFLKRRLSMIVQGKTPRAMSHFAFWALLTLGAILLPLLPIPAQQNTHEKKDNEVAQSSSGQGPSANSATSPDEQVRSSAAPKSSDQPKVAQESVTVFRFPETAASPDRSEQLEVARDQVELMEAKVQIKRAEIKELEMRIRQAEKKVNRTDDLFKKGFATESALDMVRNEAELLPSQLPTKRAELQEAEILLKQAARRLQRLEAASSGAEVGASGMAPAPFKGLGANSAGPGTMKPSNRSGVGPMRPSMSSPGGAGNSRPGSNGNPGSPAISNESVPGVNFSRTTHSWSFDSLFEEKSWDFGTVRRGEQLEHLFRITNNSDRPIRLAAVRVSAAFLKVAANPGWIGPKQSVGILVQLDTKRFSGDKTAIVYVQFDEPSAAEVRLQVQANSQDPVFAGRGQNEFGDSKVKVKELEDKIDQLMNQIRALKEDLKQQPAKGADQSPPRQLFN